MIRYYSLQLNEKERDCYRQLKQAVQTQKDSLWFPYALTREELKKIMRILDLEHPEIFHVDYNACRWKTVNNRTSVKLVYHDSKEQTRALSRQLQTVLERLSTKCRKELRTVTDYAICEWIHNYFITNVSYHDSIVQRNEYQTRDHNIVGILTNGLAVCEGIAKAYKLLCEKLGVPAIVIYGGTNRAGQLNHAWNAVKIDGRWTNIDVTWDLNLSRRSRFYRYDFFCLSDEEMRRTHFYEHTPPCSYHADLDYFYRRGCAFQTCEQARRYVEKELRTSGRTRFYFKMTGGSLNAWREAKLRHALDDTVKQYGKGSWTREWQCNRRIGICCYRLV